MSEQVIRHRGGGRDENGRLLTAVTEVALTAIAVAPVGLKSQERAHHVDQSREGESTACTVYFSPGTDVVNGDELTVRGERFSIIVDDWRTAGRGGLEVLCTRGQG